MPSDAETTETLTPGPELDRRIAEALGWVRTGNKNFYGQDYWLHSETATLRLDDALPRFSTDLSAAMTALMTFDGWVLRDHGSLKYCRIPRPGLPAAAPVEVMARGETDNLALCLAICEAILRAGEGESNAGGLQAEIQH